MSEPSQSTSNLPAFASRLVLVVGVGRSGTTVLQNALGHHPDLIDAPGEAPVERIIAASYGRMVSHKEKYRTYLRRQTRAPWSHIEEAHRRLIFEAAFGAPNGDPWLARRQDERNDLETAQRWVAKVGGLFDRDLAGYRALFDDFHAIFIHRNGIDVVDSRTKFRGFSDRSFEEQCVSWTGTVTTLKKLRASASPTVVRHIDLVEDPEDTFNTIFDALGLPSHPGPAEHCRTTVVHPTQGEGGDANVIDNLAARRPSHENWTDEERASFLRICGPSMASLGYEIPFDD